MIRNCSKVQENKNSKSRRQLRRKVMLKIIREWTLHKGMAFPTIKSLLPSDIQENSFRNQLWLHTVEAALQGEHKLLCNTIDVESNKYGIFSGNESIEINNFSENKCIEHAKADTNLNSLDKAIDLKILHIRLPFTSEVNEATDFCNNINNFTSKAVEDETKANTACDLNEYFDNFEFTTAEHGNGIHDEFYAEDLTNRNMYNTTTTFNSVRESITNHGMSTDELAASDLEFPKSVNNNFPSTNSIHLYTKYSNDITVEKIIKSVKKAKKSEYEVSSDFNPDLSFLDNKNTVATDGVNLESFIKNEIEEMKLADKVTQENKEMLNSIKSKPDRIRRKTKAVKSLDLFPKVQSKMESTNAKIQSKAGRVSKRASFRNSIDLCNTPVFNSPIKNSSECSSIPVLGRRTRRRAKSSDRLKRNANFNNSVESPAIDTAEQYNELRNTPVKTGRRLSTRDSIDSKSKLIPVPNEHILENQNTANNAELDQPIEVRTAIKRSSKCKNNDQKELEIMKPFDHYNELEIKQSSIHGLGIFTPVRILENTLIMEYKGEIIGKCMSDKREKFYQMNQIESIYMFMLSEDVIIDATLTGNKARYINHSCNPNCQSLTSMYDNAIKYCSIKEIEPGDELTINYYLSMDQGDEICRCGAENCISNKGVCK